MSRTEIFRLVYVSAISTSVTSLSGAMREILAVSVANNRRDSITGFLLCDGYNFAQALEGPQDKVEACFARISADRRNVAPSLRELAFSARRSFGGWSMCGLTLSETDNRLLEPPDIGFRLASASGGALWQHLSSLALRHSARLDEAHDHILAQAGG